MKKILLFALTALFVATSCDKTTPSTDNTDPNTENPGGNEETPKTFSASLVRTETRNIVIDVEMGAYEGNFYIGCEATEFHPGDATEYAEGFMKMESAAGTDLSLVDNLYVFSSGGEINVGNSWILKQGTEYCITVFGIDGEGNILTDISEVVASTVVVEMVGEIDFDITSATTEDVKIKVNPGSGVGNYSHCMVSTYDYIYKFASNAENLASYAISSLEYWGFSFAEVDGMAIIYGGGEVEISTLWPVAPDMSETILVYGVDSYGNINTNVAVKECIAGDESVAVDGEVGISFVNSSTSTIVVSTEMQGDVDKYFVAPCRKEYLEQYYDNDATKAAEAIIYEDIYRYGTDCSEPNNLSVFAASQKEIDLKECSWTMAAETDYIVFACGINDNGRITTDVNYIEAATINGREEIAPATGVAAGPMRSTLRTSTPKAVALQILK